MTVSFGADAKNILHEKRFGGAVAPPLFCEEGMIFGRMVNL